MAWSMDDDGCQEQGRPIPSTMMMSPPLPTKTTSLSNFSLLNTHTHTHSFMPIHFVGILVCMYLLILISSRQPRVACSALGPMVCLHTSTCEMRAHIHIYIDPFISIWCGLCIYEWCCVDDHYCQYPLLVVVVHSMWASLPSHLDDFLRILSSLYNWW